MGHVKPQEDGLNGGWADCSKLDMQNAWLSLQTPDFPVAINVEIRINFHEVKFYCAWVVQFSQGID